MKGMYMTDYDAPPQKHVKKMVVLENILGRTLLKKNITIQRGEPIGDWVEYDDMRIALHEDKDGTFRGIVPEKEEEAA
jgi:hypothetical protein